MGRCVSQTAIFSFPFVILSLRLFHVKRGGLVVELLGMVLECASPPLPVVVRIDVSRETRN